MARRIYKYSVPLTGGTTPIALSAGAEILAVGVQYDPGYVQDVLVLWAYFEVGAPLEERTFRVLGTGWPVPEDGVHRGTVQHADFVWHLMELPRATAGGE